MNYKPRLLNAAERSGPEEPAEMQAMLETLITVGRSTQRATQPNDVEVVRHPDTP